MKNLPAKKTSVVEQRMTKIFDEWNKMYAKNPSEFSETLDANGKPVKGYGKRCAIYFTKLAAELDAKNKLPKLSA
jgi:hypothetical protein